LCPTSTHTAKSAMSGESLSLYAWSTRVGIGTLKISYKTVTIGGHTGYGNASRLLLKALEDRSVSVQADSAVKLNFCMPPEYEFGDVTIGYTPWESTEVPKTWVAGLKAVDELWTPSSWVADVFEHYRSERAVVIPHGIEPCWEPVLHKREDRPFTFLHVGEPAERKGGDIVLRAWHDAFRGRKDMRLIYKCIKYPIARVKDKSGSIIASPASYDNITVLGNIMTQREMWELYRSVDCLVYPTRGEGFGLIPFEAMASGLPTILPADGGTRDFAWLSHLQIQKSMWVASTEEKIHPGLWMDHDLDELVDLMCFAKSNYEELSVDGYRASEYIHNVYSWDVIGERVERRLLKYQ
jgi:glycosyltransferase involved in cell wall biosynthesis